MIRGGPNIDGDTNWSPHLTSLALSLGAAQLHPTTPLTRSTHTAALAAVAAVAAVSIPYHKRRRHHQWK